MNQQLIELKEKLDNIYTAVAALKFPMTNLSDWGTYNHTFLSSSDLLNIPKFLSEKISKMDKFEPSSEESEIISSAIDALGRSQIILNHIAFNNPDVAAQATTAYLLSMFFISQQIDELFSFAVLKDRDLLPKNIIKKLDLYNSNLAKIEQQTGNVEDKVGAINDAYDAAENLPTTLRMLREANEEIIKLKEGLSKDSDLIAEQVSNANINTATLESIKQSIEQLQVNVEEEAATYLVELKKNAQTYLDKCEEAFRTTTSKGLAGAFEDKAKKLNASIRWWVVGLTTALLAGAGVGYFRLHALESYLSNPDSSGIKLFIQLLLSFLSVGAPLWFAWLATKQIGQRFRLAEDYEFKASVSKAYEGYRREAVQLDSDFSQRLFGNALTRLEEPPLRFVEESSHSSPMMEILSSENFKKMIERGGDSVDQALSKLGLSKQTKPNDTKPQPISNEQSLDE